MKKVIKYWWILFVFGVVAIIFMLPLNFSISKEEEKEVKYNYLTMGDSYLAWDELDDNAKNEWYRDYQIKKEYGEQYCTYYVWEQSSYWLSNRGEICQKYLSPHGDELIAFGFYGYDG